MTKHLDTPTINDWRKRFNQAQSFQRAWRSEADAAGELYELRWKVTGVPENVRVTMPSTARAVIDEATDHSDFDPHYVYVHTPTYGMEQEAEKRASRIRSFMQGWMIYQVSHMNDISPFRDYIKNQYIYGKGVLKVIYDKAEWPLLEVPEGSTNQDARTLKDRVERDREFVMPIVLRSIDPRAIYEDPSIGQKRWVIEVYEYQAQEVLPLYANWVSEVIGDMDEFPPDALIRIWDCYQIGEVDGVKGIWHQVLVNETDNTGTFGNSAQFVSASDPDQADPAWLPHEPFPYLIKFSGLGRQSPGKYEEKARGLLYAVKSLLYAEARRLTQLDSIIAAMAWPTIFVTGPRSRVDIQYGPNVVNYVPPGVTVDTISPPIPSGPIQSALATLQAGIERGTFGSVIRGDKPPQTTSAAQLAILSGQARLRFGAIKIGMEAILWETLQKVGIIIKDVIDADLTIWQVNDTDEKEPAKLVISPSDIPEKFSAHVEVLTDPAEEQDRRIQLASFLFNDNVIDMEEYRERAGIRDTASMRRRQLRDKVLFESPAIAQALGETYLIESGYDIESIIMEKAMRDLLILRRRAEMEQVILGGGPGGENPQGSQRIGPQVNPVGGSPGAPSPPTPATAQQSGEVSVSG